VPDNTVKVTISAQDEATAILRKVQQELAALKGVTADVAKGMQAAGAASKESGDSFLGMVSNLKQLAVAYGALKVIDYVGSVIESTAETARLAQVTGIGTEKLSVLKVAAEETGVSMDEMNAGLRRFATAMGNLQTGSGGGKVAADLKAIGLSAKDLQGLPLDQQLQKVVDAMAKYADGTNKMAVANALFGRSGSELLPLFSALADGGMARFEEHARATGQILTEEDGKAAIEFESQLSALKGSLEGLTRSVLGGGLLAGLTSLANLLENVAAHGRTAFAVIFPFGAAIQGLKQALTPALSPDAALRTDPDLAKRLAGPPKPQPNLTAAGARGKADEQELQLIEQAAQQRLAIEKAAAESEFAQFQSYARLAEQLEQAHYAQGILDLNAYYAFRRAAIQEQAAAEEQMIEKQIAATQRATAVQLQALRTAPLNTGTPQGDEAERIRRQREAQQVSARGAQEIAALRQKASQAQLQTQEQLNALTEEQRVKYLGILDAVTAVRDRMLEAQGQARAAAQDQIDKQVREFDTTLGQSPNVSDEQRVGQVAQYRQQLELQADFAEAQRQQQLIEQQLATERTAIQDKVKNGQMSQLDGERAIAQLEANRVPALQAIAEKMADIAQQLGNPQLANEARALSVSIGSMGHQTDEAAIASANLGSNLGQVARSGLIEYFGSGISRANGFASALQGVVGQIQQLIAKAFVLQALKILGLGVGGAAAPAASVPPGLGGAFASGGPVTGPGTGTSDSVIARLSAGEYVMSASAVARHGSAFFSALNSGGAARPRLSAGLPGFASGGLVTRTAAGGGGSHELRVTLDRGVILQEVRSSEGARIIIDHIDKNPKAARRAMRVGG